MNLRRNIREDNTFRIKIKKSFIEIVWKLETEYLLITYEYLMI